MSKSWDWKYDLGVGVIIVIMIWAVVSVYSFFQG